MAVRATYFRCGGVAVGIRISHKIADGLTFISFVNTWSAVAIANGGAVAALLKFDAAAYFPPLDILGSHGPTIGVVDEEVAARVFTFPASQIAALRERYTGPGGHRPSRVESLSAFIWTRFTSATGIGSDPGKNCVVYNAVNLRSRAKPPLSEYHFGNVIGATRREVVAGDDGVEFLRKLREATEALDADYVAGLKDREMQLEVLMDFARVNKMEVRLIFTSMCRFPFYKVDFGWGRPVWVGYGGSPYKNVVIFMDTKSGDGIDASIQLTKQDMEKFEALLAQE